MVERIPFFKFYLFVRVTKTPHIFVHTHTHTCILYPLIHFQMPATARAGSDLYLVSIQISHIGGKDPSSSAILLCLSRNINRDLDQKQSSRDSNLYSIRDAHVISSGFTHCTTSPVPKQGSFCILGRGN